MSNLNILVIRFRQKDTEGANWYFVVDAQDQPLTFLTSEAAWDKANALTEQNGHQYEYAPNVLTADMSVAEFDGNKAQVKHLTTWAEELRAQLDSAKIDLTVQKARHEADVALIGARLLDEANDRGWCRDYDAIVDDVNRNLHVELPVRMRDYDITYTISVTLTRTVEGRDGDHAYQSDPSPTTEDVCRAVRDGSWDTEDWSVCESDG